MFGNKLKLSVFGESHKSAVGFVLEGLPAGETFDKTVLVSFMKRRSGLASVSTSRREADRIEFISGVSGCVIEGTPVCGLISNSDIRSEDYEKYKSTPRPGHADLGAYFKYGSAVDLRGGGHFSGRLTAPLCAAGGLAKQLLEKRGIFVGAHILSIGKINDVSFPLIPSNALFTEIAGKEFPVIDDSAGSLMIRSVKAAQADGDSVGGTVECAVCGLTPGLGGPLFDGIESRLSAAVFGIPAVKGVEFGSGFASALKTGSENNDGLYYGEDGICSDKNDCGGILGGISTGMPVVLRAAFKPTPSISKEQKTVDLSAKTDSVISVSGRHDPCIVHRAVPVMEAVVSLAVLDLVLEGK